MKAMAMTRTEPALPRMTSAAAGMTSPDSASSAVSCIRFKHVITASASRCRPHQHASRQLCWGSRHMPCSDIYRGAALTALKRGLRLYDAKACSHMALAALRGMAALLGCLMAALWPSSVSAGLHRAAIAHC